MQKSKWLDKMSRLQVNVAIKPALNLPEAKALKLRCLPFLCTIFPNMTPPHKSSLIRQDLEENGSMKILLVSVRPDLEVVKIEGLRVNGRNIGHPMKNRLIPSPGDLKALFLQYVRLPPWPIFPSNRDTLISASLEWYLRELWLIMLQMVNTFCEFSETASTPKERAVAL